MKKYIWFLLVLIIIPGLLSAEIFAKTGTAGLQFLKIGVDARAIGMGEAYVAVTDDISSVFWNPAGLALKPTDQVFVSHTEWVAGIRYEYVAASKVTDWGTFALSGAVLHMDYMDVTTEEVFGPTGETFTCSDISAGLTYSNAFTDKFSFGITAKYLRENLDEYDVNGVSVDLGSIYNTGWKNLTIGMALRNFGPDLKYDIDNDGDGQTDEDPFDLLDNDGDGLIDEDREEVGFKIPMNFSLAISGDLFRADNQSLIGSVQLDNCVDRRETYNAGLEYKLGTFKIRSGYQFELDAATYSFGFGWTIPTSFAVIDLDYAYSNYGDLTESFIKTPHRLSLKFFF
ncbi:MAG: PorV/PorQ family protein [Candidatus Cloacimonetes bacterium]|nr:PorV/PorQ family protein [Candidatus Cloacimonadota bacterium]MCF7813038.1 PorV/PorQ family protein [Candidatus Cloacimonadota bacterium]MCF7867221.1 PorV/PorQ family protein [Candidatus Cloacimonadota bacterium]MCF7882665.1 PorV/PorQ family protein [Candidatus Cloacimonadota bacterium]